MALGMLEVFGFATSIVVADAMAKAADVKVVAIDKNKPAGGDSARVPLVMQSRSRAVLRLLKRLSWQARAKLKRESFISPIR